MVIAGLVVVILWPWIRGDGNGADVCVTQTVSVPLTDLMGRELIWYRDSSQPLRGSSYELRERDRVLALVGIQPTLPRTFARGQVFGEPWRMERAGTEVTFWAGDDTASHRFVYRQGSGFGPKWRSSLIRGDGTWGFDFEGSDGAMYRLVGDAGYADLRLSNTAGETVLRHFDASSESDRDGMCPFARLELRAAAIEDSEARWLLLFALLQSHDRLEISPDFGVS